MRTGENIRKRKERRWEAQHWKGWGLDGKIPKQDTVKIEIRPHVTAQGNRLPRFAEVCDEWLQCNQLRLKPSTCVKYQSVINKHIKPALGERSLSGLSSTAIGQFSADLLDVQGLAPKTVKDILVLLHSILEYGQKQYPGMVASIDIPYPRNPPREMRVLSQGEQRILAEYLQRDLCPCKFGILLTLWTGMRIGEICALRWDHISLQDQSIRIDTTMQRLRSSDSDNLHKTRILLDSPKTASSVRTIPLGNYVTALCRRMEPEDRHTYVLTGTERYMEPRLLQYYFQRYLTACGLKDVTFHTLRHTFATRCVEAGVEIKSLSEILGHANTTITLNRYVHSSMELKRENIQKLERLNMQMPML